MPRRTVYQGGGVPGRRNRTAHLSFAKHILAETCETRFVLGFKGNCNRWWKTPKPNHYFDATYQAIVARSMRGIGVPARIIRGRHTNPTRERGLFDASEGRHRIPLAGASG